MKKITLISVLFCLTGCSILDEDPKVFISADNFFNTEEEANVATAAIYDRLQPLYNSLVLFTDISADAVIVPPGVSAEFEVFDLNSVGSSDPFITNFWIQSFEGINRANTVISRLTDKSFGGSETEFIAEAKFLRGLFYFNLVRLYGGVPLQLEESKSIENLKISRGSEDEIYQQIVSDLEDAITNLPEVSGNIGRANKASAKALLAKVQLTRTDFDSARSQLMDIIDNGSYRLLGSISENFEWDNGNNAESIFSVQYTTSLGEGQGLNIQALPRELNDVILGSPVYQTINPSELWLGRLEEGDERLSLSGVTSYEVDGTEITFLPAFFKYSNGVFTDKEEATQRASDSGVDIPVIRYSDVLLMFAEAENEINAGSSLALEALNNVRRRAFGLDIDTPSDIDISTTDQADLREAILEERFREFSLEGHRWFDLKRTSNLVSATGIPEFRVVYPIPERELLTNENLEQNPGY